MTTPITCSHCGAQNPPGARFCRQCGKPLTGGTPQPEPKPEPVPPTPPIPPDHRTVMDRYPKYRFRSTKVYDWRQPKAGRFLRWIFRIVACLFFILGAGFFASYNSWEITGKFTPSYDDGDWSREAELKYTIESSFCDPWAYYNYAWERNDTIEYSSEFREEVQDRLKSQLIDRYHEDRLAGGSVVTGVGLFVLIFLAFLPFRGCGRPKTKLAELADYIQSYHYTGMFRRKRTPKYVFFVKDNRFGVMDVAHYRIALEAGYAKLEWREKNRLLYATTASGQRLTIDMKGNILQ